MTRETAVRILQDALGVEAWQVIDDSTLVPTLLQLIDDTAREMQQSSSHQFSARNWRMFRLYYESGLSARDVGFYFRISGGRVQQLRQRCLRYLRLPSRRRFLRNNIAPRSAGLAGD